MMEETMMNFLCDREKKLEAMLAVVRDVQGGKSLAGACKEHGASYHHVRSLCAFAVKAGYIPFAPHLLYPQFLSDDDPEQRELGLFMGQVILDGCREVWVFGDRVSPGMEREIARAKKRNIRIRYFTEECEEELS